MECIGVIGGVSPVSTAYYYDLLNRGVRARDGQRHSAHCVIYSVDLERIAAFRRRGDWDGVSALLVDAARALERAGASCVLLACNTLHSVAGAIEAAIERPFLHVGKLTARAVASAGLSRVVVLGTAHTMRSPVLAAPLAERGVVVVELGVDARRRIHAIIDEELCEGLQRDSSRRVLRDLVAECAAHSDARAVVLGCTELGTLVSARDFELPCFDTAEIHVEAALALGGSVSGS